MSEQTLPASHDPRIRDTHESFSQYLSFRFYKDNLDNLKDKTKGSINNFLKTISEIEDEFLSILHHQQNDLELQDMGVQTPFMEENY